MNECISIIETDHCAESAKVVLASPANGEIGESQRTKGNMMKTDDAIELGRGMVRLAREPKSKIAEDLLRLYKALVAMQDAPIPHEPEHSILVGVLMQLTELVEQSI